MPEYQARIILGDRKSDEIITFEFDHDRAAIKAVAALVDGHDIELWRSPVKIGTFHKNDDKKPDPDKLSGNVVSLRRM